MIQSERKTAAGIESQLPTATATATHQEGCYRHRVEAHVLVYRPHEAVPARNHLLPGPGYYAASTSTTPLPREQLFQQVLQLPAPVHSILFSAAVRSNAIVSRENPCRILEETEGLPYGENGVEDAEERPPAHEAQAFWKPVTSGIIPWSKSQEQSRSRGHWLTEMSVSIERRAPSSYTHIDFRRDSLHSEFHTCFETKGVFDVSHQRG